MKIINLEEFRKLPAGTVYCKYEPVWFDDLAIKGETWETDFLTLDLVGNVYSENSESFIEECLRGTDIELDFESYGRDALYEKDQLFAVYELKDLEGLINVLIKCKSAYDQ